MASLEECEYILSQVSAYVPEKCDPRDKECPHFQSRNSFKRSLLLSLLTRKPFVMHVIPECDRQNLKAKLGTKGEYGYKETLALLTAEDSALLRLVCDYLSVGSRIKVFGNDFKVKFVPGSLVGGVCRYVFDCGAANLVVICEFLSLICLFCQQPIDVKLKGHTNGPTHNASAQFQNTMAGFLLSGQRNSDEHRPHLSSVDSVKYGLLPYLRGKLVDGESLLPSVEVLSRSTIVPGESRSGSGVVHLKNERVAKQPKLIDTLPSAGKWDEILVGTTEIVRRIRGTVWTTAFSKQSMGTMTQYCRRVQHEIKEYFSTRADFRCNDTKVWVDAKQQDSGDVVESKEKVAANRRPACGATLMVEYRSGNFLCVDTLAGAQQNAEEFARATIDKVSRKMVTTDGDMEASFSACYMLLMVLCSERGDVVKTKCRASREVLSAAAMLHAFTKVQFDIQEERRETRREEDLPEVKRHIWTAVGVGLGNISKISL